MAVLETKIKKVLKELKIPFSVSKFEESSLVATLYIKSTMPLKKIKTYEEDIAYRIGEDKVSIYPSTRHKSIAIEVQKRLSEPLKRDETQLTSFTDLEVPLGLKGETIVVHDFKQYPHLLIGGTTGSGKTSLLHNILGHLITYNNKILVCPIDFKRTELLKYLDYLPATISPPNIQIPITTEPDRGYNRWAFEAIKEVYIIMESRYQYNLNTSTHQPLFLVIDELADILTLPKKEAQRVQNYLSVIAQKGRAANVHLILSTQRPTTDIVSGHIKANIPCRVCFRTANSRESVIVLDEKGAEGLEVGRAIYKTPLSFDSFVSYYVPKDYFKLPEREPIREKVPDTSKIVRDIENIQMFLQTGRTYGPEEITVVDIFLSYIHLNPIVSIYDILVDTYSDTSYSPGLYLDILVLAIWYLHYQGLIDILVTDPLDTAPSRNLLDYQGYKVVLGPPETIKPSPEIKDGLLTPRQRVDIIAEVVAQFDEQRKRRERYESRKRNKVRSKQAKVGSSAVERS